MPKFEIIVRVFLEGRTKTTKGVSPKFERGTCRIQSRSTDYLACNSANRFQKKDFVVKNLFSLYKEVASGFLFVMLNVKSESNVASIKCLFPELQCLLQDACSMCNRVIYIKP